MFGLFHPNPSFLTASMWRLYCRSMHFFCSTLVEQYGHTSRIFLNYESLFLHILLTERSAQKDYLDNCVAQSKCCVKRGFFKTRRPEARKAFHCSEAALPAHLSIYLAYIKINDDIVDEGKLSSKIAARPINKMAQRARHALAGAGCDVGGAGCACC